MLLIKMFRLSRDFTLFEIGRRQFETPGRPTENSELEWVMRCNFVFKTIAILKTIGLTTKTSSGWLIELYKKNEKPTRIPVSVDAASSTALLKKVLMRGISGSVARLTSEDFLDFITQDVKKGVRTIQIVDKCGKYVVNNETHWIFPEYVLNSKGSVIHDPPVIFSNNNIVENISKNEYSIPRTIDNKSLKDLLLKLGKATHKFFGPRSMYALHVYITALKAVMRDQILHEEHMVSITNVSGPPNIGKTFASSVVLRMLCCDNLMLSRCTTSSLLDKCDSYNSLLVVWDDPRDTSTTQMCSIVHEAFHGHTSSTISKGTRKYNSSIMIGTQQKLLGLSPISDNIPTLSRVSHIDMDVDTDFVPPCGSDKLLSECMKNLPSIFSILVTQKYNIATTDKMHKKLNEITNHNILDRAIRIAAIDWNLCEQFNNLGFGFTPDEIANYFKTTQMNYLSTYCNRRTPFQRFIHDTKRNINQFPSCYFKPKIMADLKCGITTECVAIYLRGIFPILEKKEGTLSYTMETIQKEVKASKGAIGDISHNVSFKHNKGNIVQRALVIRQDIFNKC